MNVVQGFCKAKMKYELQVARLTSTYYRYLIVGTVMYESENVESDNVRLPSRNKCWSLRQSRCKLASSRFGVTHPKTLGHRSLSCTLLECCHIAKRGASVVASHICRFVRHQVLPLRLLTFWAITRRFADKQRSEHRQASAYNAQGRLDHWPIYQRTVHICSLRSVEQGNIISLGCTYS